MGPSRPDSKEYAPFFAGYVARVTEGAILGVLAAQKEEIVVVVTQLFKVAFSNRGAEVKR